MPQSCSAICGFDELDRIALPRGLSRTTQRFLRGYRRTGHAIGGEVLKFIGDAVLAIFPLEEEDGDDDAAQACIRAREAAQEIIRRVESGPTRSERPHVQCAIGVHFSDVMYGNVGAQNRLDFTVIGSAPTLPRALSTEYKAQQQSLLMSAEVAALAPGGLQLPGERKNCGT